MVLTESQTEALWVDDIRFEPVRADRAKQAAVEAELLPGRTACGAAGWISCRTGSGPTPECARPRAQRRPNLGR